jgi:hypothetical protein
MFTFSMLFAFILAIITAILWGEFYDSRSKSDFKVALFNTYVLFMLTLGVIYPIWSK